MTNTLYQDIRSILVKRAATAAGYPTQALRAEEGVRFTPPQSGATWVRHTLVPSSERPASVGAGGQNLLQGMFVINVSVVDGAGTAALDALVDAIRNVFKPGTDITQGSAAVRVRYCERGPVLPENNWLTVAVTVGWHLHVNN